MSNKSNFAQDTINTNTPLYTPEQRKRRDESIWTVVQGILAPVQFIVFLVSLALVLRALYFSTGYEIATASIVLKTLILYAIMITGSIWEKVVFGEYLFVDAFFWEDVFSMAVLALHTLYLAGLLMTDWSPSTLLWIALAAYGAYVINAAQFLIKLRKARLEGLNFSDSLPEQGGGYPQAREFMASRGVGT